MSHGEVGFKLTEQAHAGHVKVVMLFAGQEPDPCHELFCHGVRQRINAASRETLPFQPDAAR